MTAIRQHYEPHSDEWFAARLGKFTASNAYLLMQSGRAKNEPFSQKAKDYILQSVAEVISDVPPMQIHAQALNWGKTYEDSARTLLQDRTKQTFETGFCYDLENVAFGSPDGENADAICEIKCPYTQTGHLENFMLETWKDLMIQRPEYYWQMQCNLHLSGRKLCYFVSYDPRMKLGTRLRIMEVPIWPPNVEALLTKIAAANELKQEYLEKIAMLKR